MKIDELITAIQELIDETFGKNDHTSWINGQAVMLKKLAEDVKSYESNRVIKVIVGSILEEELRDLTKEYEDSKSSYATYNTFGG